MSKDEMILNEAMRKLQDVFDKYCFEIYEKSKTGKFSEEIYDNIWNDIGKIYLQKRIYRITTKLGNKIELKWTKERSGLDENHTLTVIQ